LTLAGGMLERGGSSAEQAPSGLPALHFPGGSVSYAAADRSGHNRGEFRRNRNFDWVTASPAFKTTGASTMMRKTTLFVATMFVAGTALAFHCPQDMKKIDEAMAKNPKLTAAQMDEVKKYRAEGEALHKAGKHQESVDTLAKAEKILGIM
jgi:hypothetical protein